MKNILITSNIIATSAIVLVSAVLSASNFKLSDNENKQPTLNHIEHIINIESSILNSINKIRYEIDNNYPRLRRIEALDEIAYRASKNMSSYTNETFYKLGEDVVSKVHIKGDTGNIFFVIKDLSEIEYYLRKSRDNNPVTRFDLNYIGYSIKRVGSFYLIAIILTDSYLKVDTEYKTNYTGS